MRRFLILASIVALWAGALLYVQQRGGNIDPVVGRSAGFVEVSDDLGYWYSTYLHEKTWHARTGIQIYDAGEGDDIIRVLVLGDSFTEGIGLRDLSRQWPRQLAQHAAETSGKRVEVVSLSMGGTSTYTHAEWLRAIFAADPESIRMHPEQFRVLNGTYDAVFIGYVVNDTTYLPQVEQLRLFKPQTLDPATVDKVERGEIADPNDDEYRAALRLIRETVGDIPLRFLLLSGAPGEYNVRRFAEENITTEHVYPPVWSEGGFDEKYRASVLDAHPNELAHREYARRASDVLLALTEGSMRNAVEADGAYVSTPYGVDVETRGEPGGGTITAVFDRDKITETMQCTNTFRQEGRDREGMLRWAIVCDGEGSEVRSEIDNEQVRGIPAACGMIGAPHAATYSATPLRDQTGVQARIRVTSSVKRYTLYLTGYGPDDERTVRNLGTYSGNTTIDVELGAEENGIILAETSPCGVTRIDELGPWRIEITAR